MRKPKIAICLLALAMALWAARPVALADGIDWLTPAEAAPELGEEPSAGPEVSGLTPAGSTEDEDPGLDWLTRDRETPDEDPEEEIELYSPETRANTGWAAPQNMMEVSTEQEAPEDVIEAAVEQEIPGVVPDSILAEDEWLTAGKDPVAIAEEPEAVEEPEPVRDAVDWLETEEAPVREEDAAKEPELAKTSLDDKVLIEVTVPSNGEMVVNPHRLPVTLGGKVIRDQIINSPQLLTNYSAVPIIVTASVTVNTEESGGLTVTDRPVSEDETDKLACLYVEFQNLSDSDAEAAWSGGYTGASNQLLVSGSRTVSGDVLRVEAGACASYRLFGSLTENPEAGWESGDKLSVTVSFTFEEAEPDEEHETAVEADAEAVEAAAEPEEIPEMKDKADAKPEEVPEVAPERKPEPDPEPEPEPEALEAVAYEPEAVFAPEEELQPSKAKSEGLDSFATGTNPDWMRPPE